MTPVSVPDDVVALAAETYCGEGYTPSDVRAMRHVLSLPEVAAVFRPVPPMPQAERLARDAWATAYPNGGAWDPNDGEYPAQARLVAHFQALIDAGEIRADPVPDVAEALAEAWSDQRGALPQNDRHRASSLRAARALIAAGWQFIPPSSDTGEA